MDNSVRIERGGGGIGAISLSEWREGGIGAIALSEWREGGIGAITLSRDYFSGLSCPL